MAGSKWERVRGGAKGDTEHGHLSQCSLTVVAGIIHMENTRSGSELA